MDKIMQEFKVQSTGDICRLYDAILTRGAEHRDMGIHFIISVRCTLHAYINFFATNILRLCRIFAFSLPSFSLLTKSWYKEAVYCLIPISFYLPVPKGATIKIQYVVYQIKRRSSEGT